MDRIAKHTKQPEVLRELFEALGNDPFVIAECLARPALAQRLLTSWYASDQRIHGELRQRAEAELQAHNSVEHMGETSGKYSEIELVRSDSDQGEDNSHAKRGVKLNSREWNNTVQNLTATFKKPGSHLMNGGNRAVAGNRPSPSARPAVAPYQTLPIGKLSSLQEDEERYYATAVLGKTENSLNLATISWLKERLESWLARTEKSVPRPMMAIGTSYALPTIGAGGCSHDTWTSIYTAPPGRVLHTAVWTGSEMIIWGGFAGAGSATGGRYNPSTDTWASTSMTNAPIGRNAHTAVWTGSEMIVWGGRDDNLSYLNSGGSYNPGTDSWTDTSLANAPAARGFHTAVWTGNEMIVWGGYNGTSLNTGGRYNPTTNSWIATSTTNAPSGRYGHTAVWTGNEMIVWGGGTDFVDFNTGGRYNPNTDTWIATSTTGAPAPRNSHTTVWTGSEMIVWGGWDSFNVTFFNTGGRYNPGTDSWTNTETDNAPSPDTFTVRSGLGVK
jgi:hypothetical protein